MDMDLYKKLSEQLNADDGTFDCKIIILIMMTGNLLISQHPDKNKFAEAIALFTRHMWDYYNFKNQEDIPEDTISDKHP